MIFTKNLKYFDKRNSLLDESRFGYEADRFAKSRFAVILNRSYLLSFEI